MTHAMSATPEHSSDDGRHSDKDFEKATETQVQGSAVLINGELVTDPDADCDAAEYHRRQKALLRKLDFRLIPWLCILYLLAFLDRTNIGNAKIDGLPTQLGLTPGQYNASLSIFFVSYAVFEPLTNVLLKKLRPSIFLPIIMIGFGICMTLMGVVFNYAGLMSARWFLGLLEAGLFPGVNYYLSCWYRRSEFGIRAAIFFSAAAVAGSFGGLLAAAIVLMEGIAGLHGWQWIFILEGIATVVFGVISFWVIQDFPDTAKFLTEKERQRVLYRLGKDNQASAGHEAFSMKYFWAAVTDIKMYIAMVIYMGADMALYAFSLFLPTIVAGLKIGNGATTTNQLLSVPPYIAAAILTVLVGYLADKYKRRGIFNIGCSLLGITGFGMLLGSGTTQYSVKYAGTFLGALGIYPCIANTISWTANNIEGVYKRGIVLGFVIGWGNLNGVVSSNIYQPSDAPNYRPGHAVVLAFMTVCLLGGSCLFEFVLWNENRKRNKLVNSTGYVQLSHDELAAMGDKRPDFRYTL